MPDLSYIIITSVLALAFHSSTLIASEIDSSVSSSASKNESAKSESLSKESIEKVGGSNNGNTTLDLDVKSNLVEIRNSSQGKDGNSSSTKNMNYIEYTSQVFENPEDIKTQEEWGGNCTLAHWNNCKVLATWFGKYEDPKDGEIKEYLIDCKEEPVVCLRNSWTVTRCNLLCMSRCNREIQYKYDKYVSHSGECQAHAHG